ncbi:hypothetical protein OROGR_005213 [Orobanche gracilis]
MRKQNKREPSRVSLGDEKEFIRRGTGTSDIAPNVGHNDYHQNHSPIWQGGASLATSTAASRHDDDPLH